MALLAQMFLCVACLGLFSLLMGVTRVMLFYSCCESGLAVLGPAFLVVVPGLWGKIAVSIHLHVTVVLCALLNGFAFLVCFLCCLLPSEVGCLVPSCCLRAFAVLCLGFSHSSASSGFLANGSFLLFSSGHGVLGSPE